MKHIVACFSQKQRYNYNDYKVYEMWHNDIYSLIIVPKANAKKQ